MDQPDYYELLGVSPSASAAEVNAAYRSLAKSTHPDVGGNAGLFQLIKLACETLTDPPKRARYDRSIGIADPLNGLTDPLALLTLGQDESANGNVRTARAAFQSVLASGASEWIGIAYLGLAGAERDAGSHEAARDAYTAAIDTGDPTVVPAALVGLGDVERDLRHPSEARLAYQRAIATGDDLMIPSALLSLGELEEDQGNVDAARAAYQLTLRVGDREFAQMAADALIDLG